MMKMYNESSHIVVVTLRLFSWWFLRSLDVTATTAEPFVLYWMGRKRDIVDRIGLLVGLR